MGDLAGIFTAESEDIEKINGQTVCFGEVLGKHSEIEVDICVGDSLKLISDVTDEVEMFDHLGLDTGHNPFDYWRPEESGKVE
jgi:hypothetical protein